LKIAIYTIALNEIRTVERFLASCADADTIVVADTGSTDGTREALQHGGATTYSIAVRPWRYDEARNAALALVPADIDVCFIVDLDEIPAPGWRQAIERHWTPRTTIGRYRYVYSHLPNGAPAVVYRAARVHLRFGYRWRHITHEILVADRLPHEQETWLPGLQVDHWPDVKKDRTGNNIPLLEAAVAEAPNDPRDILFLGRAYGLAGRWDDSEAMLRRYLALPAARWPLGRAHAYRRLAKCRNAKSDPSGAIACLEEGLKLVPNMRDLWLDLADIYAEAADWQNCYAAARKGLDIEIRAGWITNDHRNAGGRPFYQASVAARHLGLLMEAHCLGVQAEKLEPGNPVYLRHLRELRSN
jgi:glycosyltransferase involved in cell wall biosynthesis